MKFKTEDKNHQDIDLRATLNFASTRVILNDINLIIGDYVDFKKPREKQHVVSVKAHKKLSIVNPSD